MWRILIVDDHPLVRTGLASLIGGEPDMEVAGEVATVSAALDKIRCDQPDAAIVDLSLGDGSGLELIKRLSARHSEVRLLVCSMHDEVLFAQRALNAGAMGYINKQEATTDVIKALRQVLDGKIYLSARMTERVLDGVARGQVDARSASIASLTDRELEVFGLIGQGMGASRIAECLSLSVKTIETHRDKIKKKLNLHSAIELNRAAMQWVLGHG
jgi:DNA-binding NarL/FixJ family response regulator